MQPLDFDVVSSRMTEMGSALRRKTSPQQIRVYYRILARHLDTTAFEDAVDAVLEHDSAFPSPSTLLDYGRAASRKKREVGEPYVDGMRLRDRLDALQDTSAEAPPFNAMFDSVTERLVYEDAVSTTPRLVDEPPEAYARRIAFEAEAQLVKLGRQGVDA